MKTTIDVADNILARSRELARRDHTTLRELVGEGLELVLAQREGRKKVPVKPVTLRGHGLAAQFRRGGWSRLRDAAYEGRGS